MGLSALKLAPVGRYQFGIEGYQGSALDDLYFIESAAAGFCKIGRSRNVRSRFNTIRTSNHERLTLLMRLPMMGWQESVWHAAFAKDRHKGEWFRMTPELATAIAAANRGDEWIPCLLPPDYFSADDHFAPDTQFLVDQSPENVRGYLWRDYIADLEEEALEATYTAHPDVLSAGAEAA